MTRKWIGLLIVAGMAVYSALVFPALPTEIPIHWNLSGEPDSTMARFPGAFLMVLVGIAVWLLFAGLPRIDRRRGHHTDFNHSYWLLCNLVLVFLAAAHVLVLGLGLGWDVDPVQAMLIGLGLLFVGIGPLLPRISSNRWTGIRTPWTLSNETVLASDSSDRRLHRRVRGSPGRRRRLPSAPRPTLGLRTRVPRDGDDSAAYSYFIWRELGEG